MEFAIMVTLVGLFVVFAALIILSFLIQGFSTLLNYKKKDNTSNISVASGTPSNTAAVETIETTADESIAQEELIAVLTAAILASVKNSTECNLRVKSFRRISQNSPAWNLAGRSEHIAGKL